MVVLLPKVKVRDVVAGVVVATATDPKFTTSVVNPETVKVAFCVEAL